MPAPRVLLWDIETSHNILAAFGLFAEDRIPHENIIQERYIICAAWKWLGEKRIYTTSLLDDAARFKRNVADDRHVCEVLHNTLAKADVVVAHNGDRYDTKFTEGRLFYHGLAPLPPIASVDTLKVAKKRFLFNSNRLDYLGRYLGLGKKAHTSGGLWLRVLRGEPSAIREMLRYNKQDVVLLEKIFLKLRPYASNYINGRLLGGIGCPRCGSTKTQARGASRTATAVYQRHQCQACGGWFKDTKAAKSKPGVKAI